MKIGFPYLPGVLSCHMAACVWTLPKVAGALDWSRVQLTNSRDYSVARQIEPDTIWSCASLYFLQAGKYLHVFNLLVVLKLQILSKTVAWIKFYDWTVRLEVEHLLSFFYLKLYSNNIYIIFLKFIFTSNIMVIINPSSTDT